MARYSQIDKDSEIGQKILAMYRETENMQEIANKTGVRYDLVRNFLRSMEKRSIEVVKKNEALATKVMTNSFDVYGRLVSKIEEIEVFLKQLKLIDENGQPVFDENGNQKINLDNSREYLVAWKGITETLQWWMEKRIKFMELMETEIFRKAILEAINTEFPSTARRIKEIIEEKRKELGII